MTNSLMGSLACCCFTGREPPPPPQDFLLLQAVQARVGSVEFPLEGIGARTLCLQRSRAGPLPICPKYKVCCFCRFRKYHSNMREPSLYLLLSDKEDPLYNA